MADGHLKFIIFYVLFISLMVFLTGLMDYSLLETPNTPTDLSATVDPLTMIQKFFYLTTVASVPEFQLLTILLTGFSLGMLFILIKALPFT